MRADHRAPARRIGFRDPQMRRRRGLLAGGEQQEGHEADAAQLALHRGDGAATWQTPYRLRNRPGPRRVGREANPP